MIKSIRILLLLLICCSALLTGQIVDPAHPSEHRNINPEMNNYCRTCHACDNPTKLNPCVVPCQRHGSEFTGVHTFSEGPEIVIIDKLTKLYKPVIFAHELHASMSEMSGGCILCHHYSEKTGEIPSCGKCHKDKTDLKKIDEPSLKGAYHRQCLGCHKEWSHENACQFCHEEVGSNTDINISDDKTDIVGTFHPLIEAESKYVYKTNYKSGDIVTFHHNDHVDMFGLKCTDCHKGDNCFRCHDVEKNKRENIEENAIEHVGTCCKCHIEKNCGFCHSNREKPQFNHNTSTGFVLGQYHNKVACSKCHNTVNKFTTPSSNCTDCHIHWDVGVFDHKVTGLTLNEYHAEEDCENCHIDRDFSIEPTCTNCHDDIEYPEYSPGE